VASKPDDTELVVLPGAHMAKRDEPVMWVGRKRGEPRFFLNQADWSLWEKWGRLPLVDAILLSVDLDPVTEPKITSTGAEKLRMFKSVLDAENVRRLDRREGIVMSSVDDLRFATGSTGDLASDVWLRDFREFADVKKLRLPAGFPRKPDPSARRADAVAPDDEDGGQDMGLSEMLAGAKTVKAIFEAQRDRTVDWGRWGSMVDATIQETVCLSMNVSPDAFRAGGLGDRDLLNEFHRRHAIVTNHVKNGRIRANVRGIGVNNLYHPILVDFAAWVLREMDWPPLPTEFPGVRALLAEAQTPKAAPSLGPWPWGVYETPNLKYLAMAAKQFWSDGYNRDSAPTNDDVAEWLEAQGASQRTAVIIAQILRPPDVPFGPRKRASKKK
jgi:hypothetical protein